MMKIINIDEVKEKMKLRFYEYQSFLSVYCTSIIYPSKAFQMSGDCECLVISRKYFMSDLEELICDKSLSRNCICDIIVSLCNILMILNEYGIMVGNLKSSNIIYGEKNDEIKLCDLFLNELRKDEDVCFKRPEEINGYECNNKSVIWSIGCILYEMINKKLPFIEDDNINETKVNILRCKYSLDVECDEVMKEMINRMLKVNTEDRISLKELKKVMIKTNEIKRDDENNLMIVKERKEIIFNSDYLVEISPFDVISDYYLQNNKWNIVRDRLIEIYNHKPDERILSLLLMINLYKRDNSIQDRLKFQVDHECKDEKECHLDEKIFNIGIDYKSMLIIPKCLCICEVGMNYFFRIMRQVNQTEIKFSAIDFIVLLQAQSLFGSCFSQLINLQEIDFSECHLTYHFIKSFIKSIPFMKLKYVYMKSNPVGSKGFKLILPYLHLLINKCNELIITKMDLDDESMILLSSELYKYPTLRVTDIRGNNFIHIIGLKALLSKSIFLKIYYDFSESKKELLIDKDIPSLIRSTIYSYEERNFKTNLEY